jgi:transcriptional regulator with XRE-family HTH domain
MSAPTKFSPAYCERIVSFMAKGFSLTAFAGEVGVSRETIYAWEHQHAEFGDAAKRARAARVLYWEKRLIKAERNEATPIIFALKNACADEWRQTPEISISLNNPDLNKPVEHMSADELLADRRHTITP